MDRYITGIIAADRVRERLADADHERLARVAAAHPKAAHRRPALSWRVGSPLAVVRRLVRPAEAS